MPFLRDHPPVSAGPAASSPAAAAGRARLADRSAALHAQVTGVADAAAARRTYGSDLRLYARAGIPTLHYGPGDVRQAHAPNESVPIDQLVTAAEVLTRALLQADQLAAG